MYTVEHWKIYRRLYDWVYALYIFSAYITPEMLKLGRVTIKSKGVFSSAGMGF